MDSEGCDMVNGTETSESEVSSPGLKGDGSRAPCRYQELEIRDSGYS